MPRANRHFLPGQLWHITHSCHGKAFLFKFPRDRRRYRHWLFEAKKRFGLCVLNYMVTSNHVHLLVKDTEEGSIARSMRLIAGRTGQEYNQRKARQGAFWEDRYHATAVERDEHLHRCLVYIDLNMVRAGVGLAWSDPSRHCKRRAPLRNTDDSFSKASARNRCAWGNTCHKCAFASTTIAKCIIDEDYPLALGCIKRAAPGAASASALCLNARTTEKLH